MVEGSPVIKLLVVGDPGVGKTSIIRRIVSDEFSLTHQPTVGVDFHVKKMALRNTVGEDATDTVHVQLWDTAGQDRSSHLNRVYYKGALGALVVYDISRPRTFDSVVRWKEELDSNIALPNGRPLPVVLLGNKVDLEVANVDVSYIDNFVQKHGFIAWSDISTKIAASDDIEQSVACVVTKLLSDGEVLQQTVRRDASRSVRTADGSNTPQGTDLASGGLRLSKMTKEHHARPCCGS